MSGEKRATVVEDALDAKADLNLWPQRNLRTGLADFSRSYGELTSLEQDILAVASAVYACDLAFRRGERENVTRSIRLKIPVANYHAFERTRDTLELLLYILSHDNWTIAFRRGKGTAEAARRWPAACGKTLLFSGGLDSFAAAVDLIDAEGPARVQLASHVTANRVTRGSQQDLLAYLEATYRTRLSRIAVRTGGRKFKNLEFPADADREDTQRTRSFMFLSIASLAARRTGRSKLVMIAENGQLAIHLPLSAARIGAFSTHTAHPQFLNLAADFFTKLLDFPLTIGNPYLYKTKAEVVSKLARSHRAAIARAVSCWRGARLGMKSNHCGECVPCLVRRIALEVNGVRLKEYDRDLFRENVVALGPDDEGKRNLVELAEFITAFRIMAPADLDMVFPGLFDPNIDRDAAVGMYRRFAEEGVKVLSRYPGIAPLFPSPRPGPAPGERRKPRKKATR